MVNVICNGTRYSLDVVVNNNSKEDFVYLSFRELFELCNMERCCYVISDSLMDCLLEWAAGVVKMLYGIGHPVEYCYKNLDYDVEILHSWTESV